MEDSDTPLKKVPRPTPVYVIVEDHEPNPLLRCLKKWKFAIFGLALFVLLVILGIYLIHLLLDRNLLIDIGDRNVSSILLIGGRDGRFQLATKIQLYDPEYSYKNSFWPQRILVGREGPVAGVIGDKIIIAGGFNQTLKELKSTEVFDPLTNEFGFSADMNERRQMAFGCVVGNRLYVCGGKNPKSRLSSCEYFDVSRNRWVTVSPMPAARTWAAAVTKGRYLYIIGGSGGATKEGFLTSTLRYDVLSDKWKNMAPMKTPRYTLAATLLNDNIVACGGVTKETKPLNSCEIYDVNADKWTEMAAMTKSRKLFSMVTFKGKVYALGGWEQGQPFIEKSVEVFEEEEQLWMTVDNLGESRFSASAVAY